MRYDDENPTRAPLPAPFPVGTRLRYCGTHRASYGVSGRNAESVVVIAPGIEVTIAEAHPGRRGTGRTVDLDDGEPFLDSTRDGYSVYRVAAPSGRLFGRCIHREDADEWEVL